MELEERQDDVVKECGKDDKVYINENPGRFMNKDKFNIRR